VASFGNDADPCTRGAPCRPLTQALTQTSSAGEIIILDSGDYYPVSITQSVSILASEGIYAGIRVTSGHGITVDGSGIAVFGSDAVFRESGNPAAVCLELGVGHIRPRPEPQQQRLRLQLRRREIALRDVVVAGAYGYGILANTTERGTLKLTIDRTTVRENAGTGIAAFGSDTHVVVTRSTIAEHAGNALDVTAAPWR
jgi:hypothetical protein